MPSLGADMEAGKLVEWVKRVGDTVTSGDIIAVVETQKGAIEIETFESGTVDRLLVDVGAIVPVGMPIAILRGTDKPEASTALPAAPPPGPPSKATAAEPITPPVGGRKASPAARRLAAAHAIDLAAIAGSGPDGAVVFIDVENAMRRKASMPQVAAMAGSTERRPGVDLSEMRRAIAAAMSRAKREIPHYYLSTTIDATETLAWLRRTNETRTPEMRLLASALHLRALALTLRRFPEFNGVFADGAHRPSERIHIGAAIAIRGGGLVAPAIHDTDRLSLDEIMQRLRDVVGRVRSGRLRGSEISDPTVTLTSLGERGVEAITAIINPPQVAIVGIGTPVERPWIVAGQILPRSVLTLTLAADHRVSDGHRGALMLNEFAGLLGKPEKL